MPVLSAALDLGYTLRRVLALKFCILSLYLTKSTIPATMKRKLIEGWKFPSAGHFMGKRLRLHDSAVVIAWPSTGGRFELQDPSVLELHVLGIVDPFTESNKSADINSEDAFVQRLRRLGGTFYEYQYGTRYRKGLAAEIHTWLGWPEDEEHKDGVWVLKLRRDERRKKMTGRIRLATTMQDRCRAIELCGGVFYASPTDEHLVPMEPIPPVNGVQAEDEYREQREFERMLAGSTIVDRGTTS